MLHGQIDQTPVGKAEDMGGISFVWAPGGPILVVSEAHCIFFNRLYGKGSLDDEQGKCQSTSVIPVQLI